MEHRHNRVRVGAPWIWWKTLLAVAIAGVAILAAVVVARAAFVTRPQASAPAAAATLPVDTAQAAERLAGAIRIPTVSEREAGRTDHAAFIELHAYLERAFPLVHKALQREVIADYSLLYTWPGERKELKPFALLAHLDVVPAQAEPSSWTHPPFDGHIDGGFVWGRGALDMKHVVVASLEAIEALLRAGFRPSRTVYLAFGHDEEVGGQQGARSIAELLAKRGVRLAFTLDEGNAIVEGIMPGVARPVALVGLAEKGYLTLELAAADEGGHSSLPPRDTAIVRLARAIERLERAPMPATLHPLASSLFDGLLPEMTFGYRVVFANRWLFEPLLISQLARRPGPNALIRTTATPTVVSAGTQDNVIPATAHALVNFRLLPGQTVAGVIAHVRASVGDPKIEIRATDKNWKAGRVSRADAFGYTLIERAIREAYPEAVVAPTLTVGATDSRHYERVADDSYRFIPMRLQSGDLKRIHGIDERISVSDYTRMVHFYAALLRNGAGEESGHPAMNPAATIRGLSVQ